MMACCQIYTIFYKHFFLLAMIWNTHTTLAFVIPNKDMMYIFWFYVVYSVMSGTAKLSNLL